MDAVSFHFGLPDADYRVATCEHIGVLGFIESHSLDLTVGWIRKFFWIPMPVISIKLDNGCILLREGIDAEFSANKKLFLIWNSQFVENLIAKSLNIVGFCGGLHHIYFNEAVTLLWVSIAACYRAICDVCLSFSRFGPAESFTANLARKIIFVPSLPFIGMRERAEKIPNRQPAFLEICYFTTQLARLAFSGSARRFFGSREAWMRAIFIARRHSCGFCFAASVADNGANFVSRVLHQKTLSGFQDKSSTNGWL